MIKSILFFTLLFSVINFSAESQISNSIQEKNSASTTGNVREYVEHYSNGKISVKGSLADGVKFGFWYFYDENGKLREERTYINGDSLFSIKTFSENGTLISSGYVKDFLQDGEWSFYDENSLLLVTITFKKGIRDGKLVAFSKKGHPIVVGTFVNNELLNIISIK
ncbi:MAG: toxin-antitoxin system YwqK family antitoxin [Fusobacteriaceae bacterium]